MSDRECVLIHTKEIELHRESRRLRIFGTVEPFLIQLEIVGLRGRCRWYEKNAIERTCYSVLVERLLFGAKYYTIIEITGSDTDLPVTTSACSVPFRRLVCCLESIRFAFILF